MEYELESYYAREGAELKEKPSVAAVSPFTIEIRFLGGLTESQKNAFKRAAERWTRVIVGDLPAFEVNGEIIDDILIEAQGQNIDGPGKILGQAGPTRIRPGTFLPAKGKMVFDTADLAQMEQRGTLVDVITHEMGHVLGIGTIWKQKNLIDGSGTNTPTFRGANAQREFGILSGTGPTPVPVENNGGPGTAEGHWEEDVFRNELMSGFISAPNNPLSRMTAASLQDLGYVVDLNAAEPYQLPLPSLVEAESVDAEPQLDLGNAMIPVIPFELPDDAAAQ
jgi:leishmanolysin